ncbi:hypothetical protein EW145_g4262 [Phellinidium pouzarii]|uniref:Peptidase A1 domain-containing protein n=1 Tax=Phellinidium pouzarii TaxID=167371 RepID=A0A4S4L4D2_9AGAM|nr:hypothetical protein EW145_g4262 [Phellinidium pouzarii]
MFCPSSVLTVVLLALSASVSATPLVQVRELRASLSFTRKLNISGSTLPEIDRARAAGLISKGKALGSGGSSSSSSSSSKRAISRRAASFGVTNTAVTYIASIGVGSPATSYSLLIDTGSSNTWLGASASYVKTSTSKSTGNSVYVSYGSGSFLGTEYTDTVTLSSDLVITNQSIGVASSTQGFDGEDGILGIGPVDLTDGTVFNTNTVPTVTDNLLSQGTIDSEVIGIYYAPATSDSTTNGELTFGGTDASKFTGSISYVPITGTSPASEYWGIDESITYGSSGSNVLSSTAGIVDTGTTLVLIASDAFSRYKSLSGASEDETTGLLKISSSSYANLKSLFFNIGSSKYELTMNAQTWPRSLNSAIGGDSGLIYLVVADIGTDSGQGLDFVNGYTFLERFYSVFDTSNSQVGFATTSHTSDTSN